MPIDSRATVEPQLQERGDALYFVDAAGEHWRVYLAV
jgi:hypothetical protein